MRVAITGGPSGGHAYPAMAFAEYLALDWNSRDVHLILPEKMFFDLDSVGTIPFRVHRVPGRGFNIQRPWQYAMVVGSWARLFRSTFRILDTVQPQVVVCFGTFLTLAASIWARRNQVPVIAHEQNIFLGRANHAALNWIDGLALGLGGTKIPWTLNRQLEVRVCGQIIRKSLRECAPQKNPNQFRALIFGGSQGSKQVNHLVFNALTRIDEKVRKDLVCLHIAGESGKAQAVDFYRSQGLKHEVLGYCSNIETLYARADVVIGRGGAGTMAECASFGIPLICIPFPSKHQNANASYLEKEKAAVVIREAHEGAQNLREAIVRLYENTELRKIIAGNLKRAVPVNGSETLSVWVRKIARKEMLHA